MSFPTRFDEMKAGGYKFGNKSTCKSCGEDIEWWETPRGKKIPMNPMEAASDAAVAHFKTCPDAPMFRK